jgi:hypothetical protein
MNHFKNTNHRLLAIDTSPILENSWLTGFIDADGSFDIRVSQVALGAKKTRVAARFRLEQSIIDKKSNVSNYELFSKISKELGVSLKKSIHHDIQYFCITVSSAKTRPILNDYLSRYPLKSSKYLDFLC